MAVSGFVGFPSQTAKLFDNSYRYAAGESVHLLWFIGLK